MIIGVVMISECLTLYRLFVALVHISPKACVFNKSRSWQTSMKNIIMITTKNINSNIIISYCICIIFSYKNAIHNFFIRLRLLSDERSHHNQVVMMIFDIVCYCVMY